ncbi:MAG: hypothetical protein IT383_14930 [Deltaproteobacteria bacterium]|nr:hypothetical protein [Deltaproteobacteria bacterium]
MKLVAALILAACAAAPASARCNIKNETKYSFTIESGNVSNQRVGANTSTTIAPGKIVAKGDQGKSFGGSCKDGDSLLVTEERGVVILQHK